jgi:hypothetical protein
MSRYGGTPILIPDPDDARAETSSRLFRLSKVFKFAFAIALRTVVVPSSGIRDNCDSTMEPNSHPVWEDQHAG